MHFWTDQHHPLLTATGLRYYKKPRSNDIFFTFLQEYNETESRRVQENVARQEDCDKLVSDSDAWFTESDICQFMTRKEEDVESAPPLDE